MSYSSLQSLKKKTVTETKREFHKVVIVGVNPYSLKVAKQLLEKNTDVKIVYPHVIKNEDFVLKGPNQIRGEENINIVKNLFDIEEASHSSAPLFYKESKFREFGGRSKPETLLSNEKFYTQESLNLDMNELLGSFSSDETLTQIEHIRINASIKSVVAMVPADLIERSNWSLHLSNGLRLECEKLIWADSPNEFVNLYAEKAKLSDEFISLLESVRGKSSLHIKMVFKKPLTQLTETLFIPLSYTHEWGHFIGEFKDLENGGQEVQFTTYFDAENHNEEFISKIIKILKRSLEKIFNNFKNISYEEFIYLYENNACPKIDENKESFQESFKENLFFVNDRALLGGALQDVSSFEDSMIGSSHFARGVLSTQQSFLFE